MVSGTVYFGGEDSHLYALDAGSGKLKWKASLGGKIYGSSPAVDEGRVLVSSTDGCLNAHDGKSGKSLWKFCPARALPSARPCWLGGSPISGPTTTTSTGGYVFASPLIAGEAAYVGSFDGKFYALSMKGGQPLWSQATGAAIYSSAAADPTRVYVGSRDGMLYCFEASWKKG